MFFINKNTVGGSSGLPTNAEEDKHTCKRVSYTKMPKAHSSGPWSSGRPLRRVWGIKGVGGGGSLQWGD